MYIGCYHRNVYLHNIGTVLLKGWSIKNKKQNKNKKHTTKPNTGTILLIARILEYFLTKNNLYHNHALLNYSKIYM